MSGRVGGRILGRPDILFSLAIRLDPLDGGDRSLDGLVVCGGDADNDWQHLPYLTLSANEPAVDYAYRKFATFSKTIIFDFRPQGQQGEQKQENRFHHFRGLVIQGQNVKSKPSFFLTQFGRQPKSPPPNELLPLIPMANAQVILKEKIEGLGAEADVVKVRAGYARNFLIPQGKAFEASRSNLRHVEALKVNRAAREAEELVGLQEIAIKISKLKPKFVLSTGQGGKAFGSVTSIDIHKELEAAGIVIDRHMIELEKPVKKSGKTEVQIRLHPDVIATLIISVDAGAEEKEA